LSLTLGTTENWICSQHIAYVLYVPIFCAAFGIGACAADSADVTVVQVWNLQYLCVGVYVSVCQPGFSVIIVHMSELGRGKFEWQGSSQGESKCSSL